MKITSEMDLLNEATRKKLIASFEEGYNAYRKAESFKGYECLKDKTINYVLEMLLKKFKLETVVEMQYAMSNVSILRKVIEKLAKVYANGVKRTMPGEGGIDDAEATAQVEAVADHLDLNAVMAKCNRFFRTFKNTLVYVRPLKVEDKYDITVEAKAPFNYDVVENPDNPKEALAIVLSDYLPARKSLYSLGDAALAGRGVGVVRDISPGVGAATAQLQGEEDKREFIWWTKSFHFTTDGNGKIISSGDGLNPINQLPFVNFAGDQDGCFWAEGGNDLIDSGVKINVMITDVQHIAVTQGYGQLYMTGKDLPKEVKVGPNHCIQLPQSEGEPVPNIGYLNANPPLEPLKSLIEMSVALMLTTNNLSTSGFSLSLSSAKDFASGVALMIDKSESNEDVGEQAKIFIKKEPLVWTKIAAWREVYDSRGLLTEDWATLPIPEGVENVQLNFPPAKPLITEKEHLEVLEKRQELGLNTRAELLMRDDPSLTEEEAYAKLEKIDAEKMARAESFAPAKGEEEMNGNQGQESDGDTDENDNGTEPNGKSESTSSGQNANQE